MGTADQLIGPLVEQIGPVSHQLLDIRELANLENSRHGQTAVVAACIEPAVFNSGIHFPADITEC